MQGCVYANDDAQDMPCTKCLKCDTLLLEQYCPHNMLFSKLHVRNEQNVVASSDLRLNYGSDLRLNYGSKRPACIDAAHGRYLAKALSFPISSVAKLMCVKRQWSEVSFNEL